MCLVEVKFYPGVAFFFKLTVLVYVQVWTNIQCASSCVSSSNYQGQKLGECHQVFVLDILPLAWWIVCRKMQ